MSPGTADLDALLAVARAAALEGGEVLTRYFGAAPDVRAKAPGDWVSEADLASERAVRASLARAAPEIPFFGEETGGEHGRIGWYVDPLDGTANYLHRFDAVGVSIALVDDDRPVVGVVHAPFLDRTFSAVAGGGAWRDDTPIHVSTRAVAQSICATGFPFRRKDVMADRYLSVFRSEERRVGKGGSVE